MATQNRTTLKTYFNTGDRPTQAQFVDLIDSAVTVNEDKATTLEAQTGSIDNKYMTPQKVSQAIAQLSPIKTVNSKTPSSGNVALAIADIPSLQTTLNGKQATLTSGTTIKTINGATILGSGNIALPTLPIIVRTSADITSSSATRATITGFTFAAAVGKRYMIEILGDYSSSSTTVGASLGFLLASPATGAIRGYVELQTSTVGSEKKLINTVNTTASTVNSFMTSSGVETAGTRYFINAKVFFDCSTAGNFSVQWGAETTQTGVSVILRSGTTLVITTLN
ncbi:hypothetical protein AM493_01075 [Flavobacterium akiainvivens]|uniref:Uncharacterized protein n=1 Tax=Flavobacterium akiainvivens TaxID=1202724 RepID=A0A0M8MEV0_9FLAO|nr:hypothetical protein [Flavobacterium akiainvivens]KOS04791.1 hypothetical protein AM493_01075 [Flavobacterium akiainvivens]SFQ66234.1 hypothetical protein SAMN05444144_1136 [Flavobacterium akiainvivens]